MKSDPAMFSWGSSALAVAAAATFFLVPQGPAAVASAVSLVVVGLLLSWGKPVHAASIAGLMAAQLIMMRRFLASVTERALWYSGFGVPLFVAGMMVSAFALRGLIEAGV